MSIITKWCMECHNRYSQHRLQSLVAGSEPLHLQVEQGLGLGLGAGHLGKPVLWESYIVNNGCHQK